MAEKISTQLLSIIKDGEGVTTEFKETTTDILIEIKNQKKILICMIFMI